MNKSLVIGVYPNKEKFFAVIPITNKELIEKVLDIVFPNRSYNLYTDLVGFDWSMSAGSVRFSLPDFVKHYLYNNLEVEYVRLSEKQAALTMESQVIDYSGIKLLDLKKELNRVSADLDFALDTDACESITFSLQNRVDTLRKAHQQAELNYNTFIKVQVLNKAIVDSVTKINILKEFISECKNAKICTESNETQYDMNNMH